MNVGMLWFDNDPKTEINVKIERAASYYRNKYGKTPTLCFVHPSMLPHEESPPSSHPGMNGNGNGVNGAGERPDRGEQRVLRSLGIEVRSTRSVLPNHFWIGVNGKNEKGSGEEAG